MPPAINFLLTRLILTLDLNRLIHTYSAFISIPYVQGVSDAIKRVLSQVGIGVSLKPFCVLSTVFRIPKDRIVESEKSGLLYEIPCREIDAVLYIAETRRTF